MTYEPPIAAHWDGDVLILTITREPSSIHVQHAERQTRKVYTGEVELGTEPAHHVIVADESTDCATGYCKCSACGKAVDMWDRFCRWCGAELVDR